MAILILITAPPTLPNLVLFAFLFGIANGVSTILRGAIPTAWFGPANIGRTMGALAAPMLFVGALAPLATAAIWSASGDPHAMQWLVLVLSLLGAIGFWSAVACRQRRARYQP